MKGLETEESVGVFHSHDEMVQGVQMELLSIHNAVEV